MIVSEIYFLDAVLYAQLINVLETLLWVGDLWKLKPPFHHTKEDRIRLDDWYHLLLAVAYVVPFIPSGISFPVYVLVVWLLNDLMFHVYAVDPRYWWDWICYYFNPFDDETTLWHARFGFFKIRVTPKVMFWSVVERFLLLYLLVIL